MKIKEKNNNEIYKSETSDKLRKLFEKIEAKVATNIFNKNIMKVQDDLQKLIMNISQEKITYSEVEKVIKILNIKNDENMVKHKKDFDSKINEINTKILELNNNKIISVELNGALNNKIDEINSEIGNNASINDFINLSNKINNFSNVYHLKQIKKF
jgi:thiamine pyrophosphate-dependent acetolactate synthase large subunit-like protein